MTLGKSLHRPGSQFPPLSSGFMHLWRSGFLRGMTEEGTGICRTKTGTVPGKLGQLVALLSEPHKPLQVPLSTLKIELTLPATLASAWEAQGYLLSSIIYKNQTANICLAFSKSRSAFNLQDECFRAFFPFTQHPLTELSMLTWGTGVFSLSRAQASCPLTPGRP